MRAFTCGGTINPARFVKRSTAADFTVLQADANSFPDGISQNWGVDAPIPSVTADPGPAGLSGDKIMVHGANTGSPQDTTVWLLLGGTVTRGSFLMPDANGAGITCTTTKYYGAIADESGVSGEWIKVTPVTGYMV